MPVDYTPGYLDEPFDIPDTEVPYGATPPQRPTVRGGAPPSGALTPIEQRLTQGGAQPDFQLPSERGFWEDPSIFAHHYTMMQTYVTSGKELPGWLDPAGMEYVKNLYTRANQTDDMDKWLPLQMNDPYRNVLNSLSMPDEDFLYPGEERKVQQTQAYNANFQTAGVPQQDYSQLSPLRRALISIFSTNLGAGAAVGGLASGTEGALEALPRGPLAAAGAFVGRAATGAGLGAGLTKIIERNQWLNPVLNVLDVPAEFVERSAGFITLAGSGVLGDIERSYGIESKLPTLKTVMENWRDAWDAAHLTYDVTGDRRQVQDLTQPTVTLDQDQVGLDALIDTFDRIKNGEDPVDVYEEYQDILGFEGQAKDMIGHMFADPLNVIGLISVRGTGKVLGALDFVKGITKDVEDDPLRIALSTSKGFFDAKKIYTTEVHQLSPERKLALTGFGRWISGVTSEGLPKWEKPIAGEVWLPFKGQTVLPQTMQSLAPSINRVMGGGLAGGFGVAVGSAFGPVGMLIGGVLGGGYGIKKGWGYLTNLTPASRAHEITIGATHNHAVLLGNEVSARGVTDSVVAMANMKFRNGVSISNSVFDNSYATPANMGARLAKKDVLKMLERFDAAADQRKMIFHIAEVMGYEDVYKVRQDLSAKNSADVMFERYVSRARANPGDENAQALLQAVDEGRLTPEEMGKMADLFNKKKVPMTDNEFKAQTLAILADKTEVWGAEFMGVKPEDLPVRLSQAMKAATSVALLGVNPAYLINNVLNNWVTTVAEGVFGMHTDDFMKSYFDDFGATSPRLGERATPGADVLARKGIGTGAIGDRLKKGDAIDWIKQKSVDVNEKIGFTQKWSGSMEVWSGDRAIFTGIRQYMGKFWRRGVGFKQLSGPLASTLGDIDPHLPDVIHTAIESGLNPKQIEDALFTGMTTRLVDSYVDELASTWNDTPSEIGRLLTEYNVKDHVNSGLRELKDMNDINGIAKIFDTLDDAVREFIDSKFDDDLEFRIAQLENGTVQGGLVQYLALLDDIELDRTMTWLLNDKRWVDAWDAKARGARDALSVQASRADADWLRQFKREIAFNKAFARVAGASDTEVVYITRRVKGISNGWNTAYKKIREGWAKYAKESKGLDEAADAALKDTYYERADKIAQAAFDNEFKLQAEIDEAYSNLFTRQFGDVATDPLEQWRNKMLGLRREMREANNDVRARMKGKGITERNKIYAEYLEEFRTDKIKERVEVNRQGVLDLVRTISGRQEPTPEMLTLRQARETINNIAASYGLPRRSASGAWLSNNYLRNIINKHGLRYAKQVVDDYNITDPEMLRLAMIDEAINSQEGVIVRVPNDPTNYKVIARDDAGLVIVHPEDLTPDEAGGIPLASISEVLSPDKGDPLYVRRAGDENMYAHMLDQALHDTEYNGITEIMPEVVEFAFRRKQILEGEDFDPNLAYMEIGEAPAMLNVPNHFDQYETVPPLMRMSEHVYQERVSPILEDLKLRMMSPENQRPTGLNNYNLDDKTLLQIRKYLTDVYSEMDGVKLRAIRYGEKRRDIAMLNYNSRYGMDNLVSMVFPYEFWYTRSAINWLGRAVDKPSYLTNWARFRRLQYDASQDVENLPSRLEGRMRFNFPWLADWAGGGIYVDPLKQIFPAEFMLNPFMQMAEAETQIDRRAGYILQNMLSAEEITEAEFAEAMRNKDSVLWEQAYSEAKIETDRGVDSPYDFMATISGPMLPFSIAKDWILGKQENISSLPITRFAKGMTALLGIGGPGGWDMESSIRNATGLPPGDKYEKFRIDRELSSMVGEGLITPDEYEEASLTREGDVYDRAVQRVARTQGVRNVLSSFGLDIMTEGEQIQRNLQMEYAQSIEDGTVQDFFDRRPEYAARLDAMRNWDDPENRAFSLTKYALWRAYFDANPTIKRQVREQAPDFDKFFVNRDTRDYSKFSTEQLAGYIQALGGKVPPSVDIQYTPFDLATPAELKDLDWYYNTRNEQFGENIGAVNRMYWALHDIDKQAADNYMRANEDALLGDTGYWSWSRTFKAARPDLAEIMEYKDQQDMYTSLGLDNLNPYATANMMDYAYGGYLSGATREALYYQWEKLGKPGNKFDAFLELVKTLYLYPNK